MAGKDVVNVMKWILIFINIPLFCAGAIAIGLGGWGLGSEYGGEKLRELTGSELYRGVAIAIIVGGGCLVVISVVGALGAYLENRVLLAIYFIIVLLILILYVATAAVGFAFKDELEKSISTRMKNSLRTRYLVNIANNDENLAFTQLWDSMQKKLSCCGVSGGLNSQTSWYIWQSSTWYSQQKESDKLMVPGSCCVSGEVTETCYKAQDGNRAMPPQTYANSSITEKNPNLHETGCLDKLKGYISDRAEAIAGISIAILIVMFTCILLAACVCSSVKTGHTSEVQTIGQHRSRGILDRQLDNTDQVVHSDR